jgi:hypothetical protein
MKLGKKPARPEAVKFKLANFIDPAGLPKPPRRFGHEDLVGADWKMLGNDNYGDCVFAGAAHETKMWCLEAGVDTTFTDECVLADYSALTGFDPSRPDTDQGTDMAQAADYRRKIGILDAAGNRHKIAAYLALEPGDLSHLFYATYLFGAVGIGIEFPVSAMDQFNRGRPWVIVSRSRLEGGHYVPIVARRERIDCVTWGRVQPMSGGFYGRYNDESLAYVSEEALRDGRSPEGFDAQGLLAALEALRR